MMRNRVEDTKPSTLAEAIEILQSRYPEDELASWAAEPLSEALWTAHFQPDCGSAMNGFTWIRLR